MTGLPSASLTFCVPLSRVERLRDTVFLALFAVDLPDLSAYITRNTVFKSVTISDNIVSIELKNGIVHSRWESFNDIYIVPLIKGEFKAKATLMCAEYEDPEEMEITYICE